MARIVNDEIRIIDIDWGPMNVTMNRSDNEPSGNAGFVTVTQNGADQVVYTPAALAANVGSTISYQMIDLSFMVKNNDTMVPIDVAVQRTSEVPLGSVLNGNDADEVEEFLFVLSRPLEAGTLVNGFERFRELGLDRSQQSNQGLWPSKQQTIFAQKSIYATNLQSMATQTNGQITPVLDPAIQGPYNTFAGMPALRSRTSWGSLAAIVGPQLHCYRVIIDRSQTMTSDANLFTNYAYAGITNRHWPACNISFTCKNPNFTEGEYLTRVANAMNNHAIGAPTDD